MMVSISVPHPSIGGTVGGMFRDIARGQPNVIAVRDAFVALTYDELNRRVNRLASALALRGLKPGDRVAVLSQNCIDYVTTMLACAKSGFIAACVNWRLAERELRQSIELAEPSILFLSSEFTNWSREPVPSVEFGAAFDQLLETGSDVEPTADVASEDGLIILYTSGTTGRSKGALISHRAMIARGLLMRADWAIRRDDGFIAWSPLFHMASADPTFATLTQGGTVSVVAGFEPAEIVTALSLHSVGWMVLMPGMIERLSAELEHCETALKHVAVAGCMANLVPKDQIARISGLLNAPFLNSFGSSETGIAPASGNWIEPGQVPNGLAKRQSSSCEIRLVDESGQVGEIWLRSPLLFSGYWNDPGASEMAFSGGWYHMGDDFYRDETGDLHFADRSKYLIKSGGENIYPAEIELILRNADRIADAVVVRRPDARWGEVPVAFVVAADVDLTVADVHAALDGRIARFKLPKEVLLIAPDEIERNPTGKIRRDLLEARAQLRAPSRRNA
jgi:acyl-CoA synthetase (AMP-forming)/AMP-acid ligase II